MPQHVIAEPLTQAAFAPFGDVIETSSSTDQFDINYGQTRRFNQLSNIDANDEQGQPAISIFRSQAISLPFGLKVMERHPLGSQSFIPKGQSRYLVIVALAGEFEIKNLKAFIASPEQSITYHKGTWHHYNLVLEANSDFIVIDRVGPGNNCDEVNLEHGISVNI